MSQKGVPMGAEDDDEQNALHYAARAGNTEAAKVLVEKDPTLTQRRSRFGVTPLHEAAARSHEKTVRYLMPVTLSQDPSVFTGPLGAYLLNLLILDDFYELAIDLPEYNPTLAFQSDHRGIFALMVLACKPEAFASGSRLTFWQRLLYQALDWIIAGSDKLCHVRQEVEHQFKKSNNICNNFLPFGILRDVHGRKLKQKQVLCLLKSLVDKATNWTNLTKLDNLMGDSAEAAAREGIHEFVAEVIKAYPASLSWNNSKTRTVFDVAVMHRQEKVFNILFQLGSWKHQTTGFDKYDCTMLHHAARLGSTTRLHKIPGAALQMQRELQWYKEVEKFVQPSYKVEKNTDKKTPELLFIESHIKLVNEGERWIKDTANSYTIVAALVVTIAFAAAFTLPGGIISETGLPIFLNDLSFMVFASANALALFSSTTSLLMFLGILTSRYSQEDFLRTLPMRLAIGLITLFFSITSMLIAFAAATNIMLSHRVPWIVVPIGLLACLPLTLFAFLQFPLLVEVVYSTFGPSIFGKQSNEVLI